MQKECRVVFKPSQDIMSIMEEICPDLPEYRLTNNIKRVQKIFEEASEFMDAKDGSTHESEELWDTIHACVTYLRCMNPNIAKRGYYNYVNKHKRRHKG